MQTVVGSSDLNSFEGLLTTANFLIDNLKFNDANRIYYGLMKNIDESAFVDAERDSAIESLRMLQNKLSLYLKVHAANISFGRQDVKLLLSCVNDITNYYNLLSPYGTDTPLLNYALDSHSRYSDYLSREY